VIGLGAASILAVMRQFHIRQVSYVVVAGLVFLLTVNDGSWASQTYINYWADPPTLKMYDKQLSTTDWFFRTDKRDLGLWLASQPGPLLVPLDEVAESTTRAWIMAAYPDVMPVPDTFQIPSNTRLVVPWLLEINDIRRDTRNYALLNSGVIYILPPVSEQTHTALLANIDQAQAIRRPNGDLMARVAPITHKVTFEPETKNILQLALGFGSDLWLDGWRGPDTLSLNNNAPIYTLDWAANRQPGHYYSTFLQLQSQDAKRIAGDDVFVLRWLYPTTMWTRYGLVRESTTGNGAVPDSHSLVLPSTISPGAYKLVTGVYFSAGMRLPAISLTSNTPLGDSAVIGWVKVPQPNIPAIPARAIRIQTSLADKISLRAVTADTQFDGHLHLSLYWQSMTNRPDLDATIFVHLTDSQGKIVAQQDARPWGGQYPTFIWDQGETVQTDYTFDLKNVPNSGDLGVEVGMYTFPDLKRLAVTQDGITSPDSAIHLGRLSALSGNVF